MKLGDFKVRKVTEIFFFQKKSGFPIILGKLVTKSRKINLFGSGLLQSKKSHGNIFLKKVPVFPKFWEIRARQTDPQVEWLVWEFSCGLCQRSCLIFSSLDGSISFILQSQFKEHKGLLMLKFQTGMYHFLFWTYGHFLKIGSRSGLNTQFVSYLHFPSLDSFGLQHSVRGQ